MKKIHNQNVTLKFENLKWKKGELRKGNSSRATEIVHQMKSYGENIKD